MSKRAMNNERGGAGGNVPTGKSITVKNNNNVNNQKKPQAGGGCC
jgi:hypothetical protein